MGKSILRRRRRAGAAGPKAASPIRRRIAVILLLVATILITLPSRIEPSARADEPIQIAEQLLAERPKSHSPVRIIIPKLDIDLPVVEAKVVGGYWELSENTASFGLGSAYPGQSGNTVIFAHAREGLFLPLRQVEKDTSVYVLTDDRWHRYKVTETKLVSPKQVEVVSPTENEQLTLFTCSGFLDTKRLIVIATPTE